MAETIVASKTGLPMKAAPTTQPQWGPEGPVTVKAPPIQPRVVQPRVVKAFPVAKTTPDPPRPLTKAAMPLAKAAMLKAVPPPPPRQVEQRAALVITQQWLIDEALGAKAVAAANDISSSRRTTAEEHQEPPASPGPLAKARLASLARTAHDVPSAQMGQPTGLMVTHGVPPVPKEPGE